MERDSKAKLLQIKEHQRYSCAISNLKIKF